MKSSLVVALLLGGTAAGCAAPTARVLHADPAALTDHGLRIAVLDPYDATGVADTALLQMNLTRALHMVEFNRAETKAHRTVKAPWNIERAAARAREHKADAALVVAITWKTYPKGVRRAPESGGLAEPEPPGGVVKAEIRLVDAGTSRILYRAELMLEPENFMEGRLADELVAPMGKY